MPGLTRLVVFAFTRAAHANEVLGIVYADSKGVLIVDEWMDKDSVAERKHYTDNIHAKQADRDRRRADKLRRRKRNRQAARYAPDEFTPMFEHAISK